MRPQTLGRLGILGAAAIGAIVGHCLTYVVAIWDEESRHAVMAETGHAYWEVAIGAAIVLGIWLGTSVVLRHLHLATPPPRPMGIVPLGLRLAVLQLLLFAAIEVGERVVVAVPMEESFLHEVLSLGAAIQAAVALAIAVVLRLLVGAAKALAGVLRSPLPAARPPIPRPSLLEPLRPVAVLAGGPGVRGPPSLR